MLTKRTYIVPALVAAIVFPAAALAADGGNTAPQTGIADAKPATLTPLERPTRHFQQAIRTHVRKARAAERRQRREAFAALPGGVSRSTLEAIASCESGGDPTIVSSGGTYRGKYQFSFGTWASVGGSGDPAAASEAEQDYRAALLYAGSGSSPWPVCGA